MPENVSGDVMPHSSRIWYGDMLVGDYGSFAGCRLALRTVEGMMVSVWSS